MQLTLKEISSMCGGELSTNSDENNIVSNVVINDKEVEANSLFVAIVGNTNDGHRFVASSFSKGALGAMVNKSGNNISIKNLILVEDTTKALGIFANRYREMFNIPIVAITGSNGKTTAKEMLKKVCEAEFGKEYVLASQSSFNNHWGMPLTLLRLTTKHKIAILEMGMNHRGELNYLSNLAKPTIAVVNNVLMSHTAFFNDLEDIAKAKGEIYNGLISGGLALINSQIPFYELWLKKLVSKNIQIKNYGKIGDYCYLKTDIYENSLTEIFTDKGIIKVKLQVLGKHNQYNAVTVTALALELGCCVNSIKVGLESYKAYQRRMETKVAFNGATVIDDSYNANPDSVRAAVLAIANLPTPHWMIFGDLKELGDKTLSEHVRLGQFMFENGINKLLTLGDYAHITGIEFLKHMVGEAIDAKEDCFLHFTTKDDIVAYCKEYLPTSSTLLVKASNSMKFWEIIDSLVS